MSRKYWDFKFYLDDVEHCRSKVVDYMNTIEKKE
jgi:hypothetical protein